MVDGEEQSILLNAGAVGDALLCLEDAQLRPLHPKADSERQTLGIRWQRRFADFLPPLVRKKLIVSPMTQHERGARHEKGVQPTTDE